MAPHCIFPRCTGPCGIMISALHVLNLLESSRIILNLCQCHDTLPDPRFNKERTSIEHLPLHSFCGKYVGLVATLKYYMHFFSTSIGFVFAGPSSSEPASRTISDWHSLYLGKYKHFPVWCQFCLSLYARPCKTKEVWNMQSRTEVWNLAIDLCSCHPFFPWKALERLHV